MRHAAPLLAALGLSLAAAACTDRPAPPAPDPSPAAQPAKALPTAPPTVEPPAAAQPAAAQPAAAPGTPPVPADGPAAPAAASVFSDDIRSAVAGLDPEVHAIRQPMLGHTAGCVGATEDVTDACRPAPGVVGIHPDGRLALLVAETAGGCGDGWPRVTGQITRTPGAAPERRVALPDPKADEMAAYRATWRWLGELTTKGFGPAPDLITAEIEQPSGIRSHSPVVVLGPPLAGWYVEGIAGPKEATFRLVSPDQTTTHPLGAAPNVDGKCDPEDETDGLCADATAPSVLQIVRKPGARTLYGLVAMGDGTHCGTDSLRQVTWTLPDGVPLPE